MAAPLLSCALVAALSWAPAKVVTVTFEPEHVQTLVDLRRAFGVVEGEPLSRVAIRTGVQALIASRAVEDVVVEVRERHEGVELVVRLQLASRVTAIEVRGVPRRERGPVLTDLGVAVGDQVRVAAVRGGRARAPGGRRARGGGGGGGGAAAGGGGGGHVGRGGGVAGGL